MHRILIFALCVITICRIAASQSLTEDPTYKANEHSPLYYGGNFAPNDPFVPHNSALVITSEVKPTGVSNFHLEEQFVDSYSTEMQASGIDARFTIHSLFAS